MLHIAAIDPFGLISAFLSLERVLRILAGAGYVIEYDIRVYTADSMTTVHEYARCSRRVEIRVRLMFHYSQRYKILIDRSLYQIRCLYAVICEGT